MHNQSHSAQPPLRSVLPNWPAKQEPWIGIESRYNEVEMLTNRMLVSSGIRLVVIIVIAVVGVIAAQVKSATHSPFVLSSPDARLAVRVPGEYTANVFG